MKSEKQLLEQRANIVNQVRDKWADVRKESRDANAEELAFFDKADSDILALTAEVENLRKASALADKADGYATMLTEGEQARSVLTGKPTSAEHKADQAAVLRKWMVEGAKSLTDEERSVMGAYQRGTSTQISSTANLGGYAMSEEWANELYKAMLWYGGALEACGIKFKTSGGGDFHFPTTTDTSNKAAIIGQGTGDTVKDLTLAEKVWKAWSYSSGLVKWSWESFDDLGFDIVAETRNILAERMGRGLNYDFTVGTDTTMPQGLVPGSTLGKAAASATAITRSEIVDLTHSVDISHRSGPKVGFMLADTSLAAFKKLTIGTNDDRPLWQPSVREGEPDRIEGYKYWINNDVPAMTTGLKSMLFGNFDKYAIRQTGGYILGRSDERYFEERAVAFSLFARFDGRYLDTAAVKHILQA